MALNADYDALVVIDTRSTAQNISSEPGIVRYAPGLAFVDSEQGLGEEFLMLSGTFEDEAGAYPAGTYVWNPPGWQCRSASGCELFVKWGPFQAGDDSRLVIDTRRAQFRPGLVPGLSVLPLHEFGTENVALVRCAPDTLFQPHSHWGGEEVLVLDWVFSEEHGDYPAVIWLRSPHLSSHHPFSEPGCPIYVKVGYLQNGCAVAEAGS